MVGKEVVGADDGVVERMMEGPNDGALEGTLEVDGAKETEGFSEGCCERVG
jgi:hypothetical protein